MRARRGGGPKRGSVADLILYRRANVVRARRRLCGRLCALAAHGRAQAVTVSIYTREPGIYTAGILILAREAFPRHLSARHRPGGGRGPRGPALGVRIIDSVGARLSFVSRPRPRLDNICVYTQTNTRLPRPRRASLARNREDSRASDEPLKAHLH